MVVVTAACASKRLREILRGSGALSMLCADTSKASFFGKDPDIILVTQRESLEIACENAVLIIRKGGKLPESITCKNVIVVADSSDPATLSTLSHRKFPAVTCGLSVSDTFTLSSLTIDSAVISLQRELTAFDGSLVEPFELPVVFSNTIEPFELLAAAAILCLMGKRSPLLGAAVWSIPPRSEPNGVVSSANRQNTL